METIILILALWFGPGNATVAELHGYRTRAECWREASAFMQRHNVMEATCVFENGA